MNIQSKANKQDRMYTIFSYEESIIIVNSKYQLNRVNKQIFLQGIVLQMFRVN